MLVYEKNMLNTGEFGCPFRLFAKFLHVMIQMQVIIQKLSG